MTARQEEFKDPADEKNKIENRKFLEHTQCRLVGKYFCYRDYQDELIRIRRLDEDQMTGFKEERHVNINPVLFDKKEDCKYIQFNRVPVASYQMIKGEQNGEMTYYEDLLEVSIRNTTFMFDLDDETGKPREVNFIEGTDQLLKLNGFVN